jgi:hypothetical protein
VRASPHDAVALELLRLAGSVLADRVVWTNKVRAATRWKEKRQKPILWADDPSLEPAPLELYRWEKVSCAPTDRRATQWSVMGALEMAAEMAGDDPNGPEVVRALDLLHASSRGWTISRIEDAMGHKGMLWAIATAVSQPMRRLAPMEPGSHPVAVDRKPGRDEDSGNGPATLRSSELRRRRRHAA